MASMRTFHWNGKDLPEALQDLPPGTYVVESLDQPPPLTPEEDQGLKIALASLRAENHRTLEQVQRTIDAILRR